jgi:hypothetical protein
MIKRYTLFFQLLLAAVILMVNGFGHPGERAECSPAEAITPPTGIIISYPLGGGAGRGAVQKYFNHARHAEEFKITCSLCHHVYEDGRNVWKEGMPAKKCSVCHHDPALRGERRLTAGFQLKKLLSQAECRGCHMSGYLARLKRYGVFPGK